MEATIRFPYFRSIDYVQMYIVEKEKDDTFVKLRWDVSDKYRHPSGAYEKSLTDELYYDYEHASACLYAPLVFNYHSELTTFFNLEDIFELLTGKYENVRDYRDYS